MKYCIVLLMVFLIGCEIGARPRYEWKVLDHDHRIGMLEFDVKELKEMVEIHNNPLGSFKWKTGEGWVE